MKKHIFCALSVAVVMAVTSCTGIGVSGIINGVSSDPNSPMKHKEIGLGAIKGLNVTRGITVVYVQDSTARVDVSAPEDLMDIIKVTEADSTLTVSFDKSVNKGADKVTVYVHAPSVSEFRVSAGAVLKGAVVRGPEADVSASSGSVFSVDTLKCGLVGFTATSGCSITGVVECDALVVEASSGSSVTLCGNAVSVDYSASSGASVDASRLSADSGVATSSSGAGVSCKVKKLASSRESSGGSVSNIAD